jgi:hypothetical protein
MHALWAPKPLTDAASHRLITTNGTASTNTLATVASHPLFLMASS